MEAMPKPKPELVAALKSFFEKSGFSAPNQVTIELSQPDKKSPHYPTDGSQFVLLMPFGMNVLLYVGSMTEVPFVVACAGYNFGGPRS